MNYNSIDLFLSICTSVASLVAIIISIVAIRNQNKLQLFEKRIEIIKRFENIVKTIRNNQMFYSDGFVEKLFNVELSGMTNDDEEELDNNAVLQYLKLLGVFSGPELFNKLSLSKGEIDYKNLYLDLKVIKEYIGDFDSSFAIFKKKQSETIITYIESYTNLITCLYLKIINEVSKEDEIVQLQISEMNKYSNLDETLKALLNGLETLHNDICKSKFIENLYKTTKIKDSDL